MQLAKRTSEQTGLNRTRDLWDWFDNMFNASWSPGVVPAMDLEETEDAYRIHAELPGVDPKELDISVRNEVLTISGEKKQQSESEGSDYYRMERRYGAFSRTVRLPGGVDSENIQANSHNGVLTLTIPKSERAKPRRIEVNSD